MYQPQGGYSPMPRYPYQPPPPPKRRKVWPWILGAVLTVVAVAAALAVIGFASRGRSAPSRQVSAPPPPRSGLLKEQPGTEPVPSFLGTPTYNACAVLNRDVLAAAGLTYSDGFLTGGSRLGADDGDRRELIGKEIDQGMCGGPVDLPNRPDASPQVLFSTVNKALTGSSDWQSASSPEGIGEVKIANGVKYGRLADKHDGAVQVGFGDGGHGVNAFKLDVTSFSSFPDGESVLAKLVDGITRNIAAGLKPMPERSYPEPYNLTAKPCDAFPPALFTTFTDKQTDGIQRDLFSQSETPGETHNAVSIRCERGALVNISEGIPANVTVEQTIYSTEDPAIAAAGTKELCDYKSGTTMSPLPSPIGDVSCGADGGRGSTQVLFHAGRTVVRVSVLGKTTLAKVAEGAQQIYARLNS